HNNAMQQTGRPGTRLAVSAPPHISSKAHEQGARPSRPAADRERYRAPFPVALASIAMTDLVGNDRNKAGRSPLTTLQRRPLLLQLDVLSERGRGASPPVLAGRQVLHLRTMHMPVGFSFLSSVNP